MPKRDKRNDRMRLTTPRAGGGPDQVYELPFKLLVLGDFTLRGESRTLRERQPTPVERHNFDEVMRAENLRLSIRVPNRLTDESGTQLGIDLAFASLDDFGPDKIVAQVPQLQHLLSLRAQLQELRAAIRSQPRIAELLRRVTEDGGLERLRQEFGRGKGHDVP